MKPLLLAAAGCLLSASVLHAQWKTETYSLTSGWNSIWLHGDATHATPSELFAAYPAILEIWRWNPNPDLVQFTDSPSDPDATSSEWTIWNRDDSTEQKLTSLIGQSAYLVRCSEPTTLRLTQRPLPPAATWLITGANFLGFPSSASTPPLFSSYFASFPAAATTPSKIYKYIGGDLGASNPFQITPTSERLDRNTAYWFEAATVGDFTAPVEYELPGAGGLAFGRTANLITVGVMNRSTSALTLTFSTENSESAPTGQTGVTGPAPLTRRTFDTAAGAYVETPVTGQFNVSIPASGRLNLEFGIDRSQLTGSSSALYASFLRVKDSAGLSDALLPVSAQIASPAGLWIGQVDVSAVASTVASSPGDTTSRSFPLRVIVHVDENGDARLLSQAFVGTLASAGHLAGVCTRESLLLTDQKSSAIRVSTSHMPLDRVILPGSGSFGSSLDYTVSIPFDDPTNPFLHAYHPDHDNRDPRFAPYHQGGAESYDIIRRLTFTFTSSPPDGGSISGWGATVYGGTYSEQIHGLNKNPLTVGGTFLFRRISEIAEISIPTID